MNDLPLFEVVTAHCFWGRCGHIETGIDADQVHDAMEVHYAAEHRSDLDALLPKVSIRAGVLS